MVPIHDFNSINKMKEIYTSVSAFAVRMGALVPDFENSNSHRLFL